MLISRSLNLSSAAASIQRGDDVASLALERLIAIMQQNDIPTTSTAQAFNYGLGGLRPASSPAPPRSTSPRLHFRARPGSNRAAGCEIRREGASIVR